MIVLFKTFLHERKICWSMCPVLIHGFQNGVIQGDNVTRITLVIVPRLYSQAKYDLLFSARCHSLVLIIETRWSFFNKLHYLFHTTFNRSTNKITFDFWYRNHRKSLWKYYNDHLIGYLSAFWSSSRWPRFRRQKLLARVNWYLQSSLKHITE